MANNRDKFARVKVVSLPSAQELAIQRNAEFGKDPAVGRRTAAGRGQSYSMTGDQAVAAASLMERSQVISPLAGLPVSASAGDFAFAKGVLGAATGEHGIWDDFWEDDQAGYDYENQAGQIKYDREGEEIGVVPGWQVRTNADNGGRSREPAPLTLVPTSTTNPERPRTVAAGFDEDRLVLTVVFRDGTFYNYYDVEPTTWQEFKQSWSKGVFIRETLDYYGRGTASMAKSPVYAREQAYRIARTGQLVNDGQPKLQFDRTLSPRVNPTVQRRRTSASQGGTNPIRKPSAQGPKRR
jgi:hypothetical protein